MASDARKAIILKMTRKISRSTQYHLDAIMACKPRDSTSAIIIALPTVVEALNDDDSPPFTRSPVLPDGRDDVLKSKSIVNLVEHDIISQNINNALKTFTHFPVLPQEIQDRIWLAFDEPRKVSTSLVSPLKIPGEVSFRRVPVICQITKHLSQEVFNQHIGYVKWKRSPNDFSSIFFRPDTDLLVLNHMALSTMGTWVTRPSAPEPAWEHEFKLMQSSFGKLNLFNKLKCIAVYISTLGVSTTAFNKLLGNFIKYKALELVLIIITSQCGLMRDAVDEKKFRFVDMDQEFPHAFCSWQVEVLLECYARQGHTLPKVKFVCVAE